MSDPPESYPHLAITSALCIDGDVLDRLGRVLRYLVVGLVEQAVSVQLVSDDPRVMSLRLGPTKTVLHHPVAWPMAKSRLRQLAEQLTVDPPVLIHALSGGSYRVAAALADALDVELVLQVTSLHDCEAIAQMDESRIGAIIALSQPLVTALETQLQIAPEKLHLVRPGVMTDEHLACFADEQREPTILCTSAFERDRGVDRLIEAVDLLRQRGCNAMTFLLGQGRYESALRRMVRHRRLTAQVTFSNLVGGLLETLQSCDILVRPSSRASITADPLLAMARGVAVVSLPNAICDHFQHEQTAYICSKPTAESLADALERLITDIEYARRIATSAREYIRQNHAISTMAERICDVYRELALSRATFPIRE